MPQRRFKLILRRDWNARPARGRERLPAKQAEGVAIHYSASGSPRNHRDCFPAVREIQRMHIEDRGWLDGAYSHIVCPHGYTFRMRGIGVRTAANGTTAANSRYYAICYLGRDNVNREDFTDAAKQEMAYLLHDLYMRQIGRDMRVRPHSDFVATSCPGDEIRRWLKLRLWLQP